MVSTVRCRSLIPPVICFTALFTLPCTSSVVKVDKSALFNAAAIAVFSKRQNFREVGYDHVFTVDGDTDAGYNQIKSRVEMNSKR